MLIFLSVFFIVEESLNTTRTLKLKAKTRCRVGNLDNLALMLKFECVLRYRHWNLLRPVRTEGSFPNSRAHADTHEADLLDGTGVEVVCEVFVEFVPHEVLQTMRHLVCKYEPGAL